MQLPERVLRILRRAWPVLALTGILAVFLRAWIADCRTGIGDPGDPLLTVWILSWAPHQLLHDPLRLFQGNIFFPWDDSLAFSEHLFVPAILAAPFEWASGNPVLAQNASILTSFLVLGLGVYFLLRAIGLGRGAAFVAALLAVLSPLRFARLSHLHLLHLGWLPLSLLSLSRFLRTGRTRHAALFTLALNAALLSGYYVGAMTVLSLTLFGLAHFMRRRCAKTLERPLRLLPWLALTAAVNLPFLVPYFRVSGTWGFVRTLEECRQNAAEPADFLRRPSNVLILSGWSPLGPPRGEKLAYSGLGVAALALLGFAGAFMSRARRARAFRIPAVALAAAAVGGALLALGPWADASGQPIAWTPYGLFWQILPGFKGLRGPARFMIVSDLAACLLAGLACHLFVTERKATRGMRGLFGTVATVLLVGTALVERLPAPSGPLFHVETGNAIPEVYRWLANRPDCGVVLFLPMSTKPSPGLGWDPTPYREVYFSTVHWKPMLNGVSGFVPPPYEELRQALESFPDAASLERIRRSPADTLVVHRRLLSRQMTGEAIADLASRGFQPILISDSEVVFRIPKGR